MAWTLLYSGGLDSTVALYDLLKKKEPLLALSLLYGQRHRKELEAARKIAARCKIEHLEIDLMALQPLLKGNSQTDLSINVPQGHYTEESMKATVVPNRNMIFLSVGLAAAIARQWKGVVYAAHGGDHTIYPDCRPEFVQKMNEVAGICDWHSAQVKAPFLNWTKADIVRRGAELDIPFDLTWSCYEGRELHCGKCGTCVERKEAFREAKVPDPTRYES